MNKYFPGVFAVWALLLALFTGYSILLGLHAGPYRDMWVVMDFIRGWFSGEGSLPTLFSLHGGAHRLVIPKLLFLVEYGLFAGSNLFLVGVAVLMQASVVYLIWCWVREETPLASETRLLLVALCVLLMFNATQLENFLYTFDVQWFITAAAAAWALRCWILSCAMEVSTLKRVVYASVGCIWGFISLFSSFSGICAWLLLPLIAMYYRRRLTHVVIMVGAVMLLLFLYTRGSFGGTTGWITVPAELTPASLAHFVVALGALWLKWIFLYLGSPLGRESAALAALWVTISFVFLGFQVFRLWRTGPAGCSPFQIWCLFLALFAAAVGLVTGWGRMHFVHTADEDRYQSIVALYWLGVFSLAYIQSTVIQSTTQKYFRCAVMAVLFVWTAWVIPYAAVKDARAQLNFFNRVNTANLAIATGQWELQQIKSTLILGDQWKQVNRPEMHGEFLREKGWGIFATEPAQQLGRVVDIPVAADTACEGQILSVTPVAGYQGYRVSGQAYDVTDAYLIKTLLLVDMQQRVLGLGRLQREKDSLWPVGWQARDKAQWVAYTVNLPAATLLQVLGERGDGSYCRVKNATIRLPLTEQKSG